MQKSIHELLGDKIRLLRKQNNMSIEELSYQSGIDYSYLCKIQKGKVNCTVQKLYQLSLAFNTDVKELFNFDK